MSHDESTAKDRLEGVLLSLFCPMAGCWPSHGCHYEYFFDPDADAHVLEVWPVGLEESEALDGNGHHESAHGVLYELAELDFTALAKEVPLEHFHFSQWRSIFEISWNENGQRLELRLHIAPLEVGEDEPEG